MSFTAGQIPRCVRRAGLGAILSGEGLKVARKNKRLVTLAEEKARENEFKAARWKLRAWMENRGIKSKGRAKA